MIKSYFEIYACTIPEQETGAKGLVSRRNKKVGANTDNCYRLCKNGVEGMFHVKSSCRRMSSQYYLLLWHGGIATRVYE